MRSSWDVLRSAKKYLSEFVVPDYEVRLSSEEGAWERPFIRVAWVTPTLPRMLSGGRQVETRRTLSIVGWPEEVTEDDGPGAAVERAEALVEALTLGFMQGLHTESWVPERGRAHPLRVPIWNYAGKALDEPADDGDRVPQDFASIVEEPSVGTIRDPNTDLSLLVTCDLRLRWTRSVAIVDTSPVVETVTATPDNT